MAAFPFLLRLEAPILGPVLRHDGDAEGLRDGIEDVIGVVPAIARERGDIAVLVEDMDVVHRVEEAAPPLRSEVLADAVGREAAVEQLGERDLAIQDLESPST